MDDLFIDIGVGSRKDAEKLVRIGDPITLADQFELLRNDLAIARAFDNRIGTFAVAETLAPAARRTRQTAGGSLRRLQRQEEVGLLGARQIAYTLKPDVALVVDVTHATDYPTVSKPAAWRHQNRQRPDCHPRRLQSSRKSWRGSEAVAKANKIPLQHEATSATAARIRM